MSDPPSGLGMVEVKTKRFFTCPTGCAHEFFIEHLFEDFQKDKKLQEKRAGPWYCDTCGTGWRLQVFPDGSCKVEPSKRLYRQLVLLEIRSWNHPIQLIVEGVRLQEQPEPEHDRYFYEEHTCPTNYFRSVRTIKLREDEDPHGLARYVQTLPWEER